MYPKQIIPFPDGGSAMPLMNEKLDKNVPIPLYYQLKSLILNEIKNGTYPPGSMIPTENELIDQFGISRTTVRQAVTELVQEGYLYRIKSKGTFVTQPKINQDFLSHIESYNTEMMRKGFTPSTEVLDLRIISADENIADHLSLQKDDPVVYLYRLRYANGNPIVTIKTYLPDALCHFLLEIDFAKEALYAQLGKSAQTKIARIHRHVEATEANSDDAKLLHTRKGKPILLTASIGSNIYGTNIEYSIARYRGDRSAFEVDLAPEET